MRIFTPFPPLAAFTAPDTARAGGTEPVAEIVTFRLVPGAIPADFVRAAIAMTPALDATEAVLSRTLSVDSDGLWTDHVTWTGMAAATAAAETVMQDPASMPFLGMIEAGSVTLRHADIKTSLRRE